MPGCRWCSPVAAGLARAPEESCGEGVPRLSVPVIPIPPSPSSDTDAAWMSRHVAMPSPLPLLLSRLRDVGFGPRTSLLSRWEARALSPGTASLPASLRRGGVQSAERGCPTQTGSGPRGRPGHGARNREPPRTHPAPSALDPAPSRAAREAGARRRHATGQR